MCNFGAEIPVSLFLRLDSRSAESMNKAINGAFGEDGFNPEYLVVDGYPGYPALIRKREGNWSRSLCLAHLRRYLCEALGFSSWEKARCVAPVFSRPNSPNLSLVGRWPPIWPSLAAVPSKSGRQAVLVGRAPLPLGSCREARGRAL